MYGFEKIDINLHVRSLEETFEWYKDVLGWESNCDLRGGDGECLFGDVHFSYDPYIGFNLNKANEPGAPSGFHPLIKTTNIAELYERARARNVRITAELSERPWGIVFEISDCNGFRLEFWSEKP